MLEEGLHSLGVLPACKELNALFDRGTMRGARCTPNSTHTSDSGCGTRAIETQVNNDSGIDAEVTGSPSSNVKEPEEELFNRLCAMLVSVQWTRKKEEEGRCQYPTTNLSPGLARSG